MNHQQEELDRVIMFRLLLDGSSSEILRSKGHYPKIESKICLSFGSDQGPKLRGRPLHRGPAKQGAPTAGARRTLMFWADPTTTPCLELGGAGAGSTYLRGGAGPEEPEGCPLWFFFGLGAPPAPTLLSGAPPGAPQVGTPEGVSTCSSRTSLSS